MNAESLLEAEFARFGVQSGSELFLPHTRCHAFIQRCLELEVAVIGIEAFSRMNESFTPRLDMLADFSSALSRKAKWLSVVKTCADAALGYLARDRETALWYVFTVIGQDELQTLTLPGE